MINTISTGCLDSSVLSKPRIDRISVLAYSFNNLPDNIDPLPNRLFLFESVMCQMKISSIDLEWNAIEIRMRESQMIAERKKPIIYPFSHLTQRVVNTKYRRKRKICLAKQNKCLLSILPKPCWLIPAYIYVSLSFVSYIYRKKKKAIIVIGFLPLTKRKNNNVYRSFRSPI